MDTANISILSPKIFLLGTILSVGIANPSLVRAEADVTGPEAPVATFARPDYIPSQMLRLLEGNSRVAYYDVRGTTSFAEEHIKGAFDISLKALREGKIPPMPDVDIVVTYCGCPHAMAEEAAEILLANGYKRVAVLDDGFYGWKDNGFPIEIASGQKQWQRIEMRGNVGLQALLGQKIEVEDSVTGQMEVARIEDDGSFVLHMPYYGDFSRVEKLTFRAAAHREVVATNPKHEYKLFAAE